MDAFSKHWLQQLTLLNGSKCCGTQTWCLGQECGWLPKPPAAGDEAVQSRGRWLHPPLGLTAAVVAGREQKLSPHRAPVRSGCCRARGLTASPPGVASPSQSLSPQWLLGGKGGSQSHRKKDRSPSVWTREDLSTLGLAAASWVGGCKWQPGF